MSIIASCHISFIVWILTATPFFGNSQPHQRLVAILNEIELKLETLQELVQDLKLESAKCSNVNQMVGDIPTSQYDGGMSIMMPQEDESNVCGFDTNSPSRSANKHIQWSWIVQMEKNIPQLKQCISAAISDDILITSAHCFDGLDIDKFVTEDSRIQSVTLHPDYEEGMRHDDIALIKLNDPLYRRSIVCTPNPAVDEVAIDQVHGLGYQVQCQVVNRGLDCANAFTEFVPMEECAENFKRNNISYAHYFRNAEIPNKMLCIKKKLHVPPGPCHDANGALAFSWDHEKRSYIVGVIAFGDPNCGKGDITPGFNYGIYTRTAQYLNWISYLMDR